MITLSGADLYSLKDEVKRVSLLRRIPLDEISFAAHAVWYDKSIADKITSETMRILNQTYARKFVFFNGKSSKSIVGGLFYLLSYRYNAIKKQNELANQLGTTDVSIRVSYRKWLETFPDLFLDVIAKFASISALRSFVLLDLKQSLLQSENRRSLARQQQSGFLLLFQQMNRFVPFILE